MLFRPEVLLLILAIFFIQSNNGGMPSGGKLNLVGSQIRKLIGRDLKSWIKIPDQNIKKGKLYNIRVVNIDYPNVKVSATSSTLYVIISNFGITLYGKWKAKFLWWRPRGSFSAKGSGIGISLKLNIKTLKVLTCYDWIRSVNAKFSGSNLSGKILSWILKVFRKRVNRRIKRELDNKICWAVRKLIYQNRKKILALLR